jgi:hypothetical protein
MQGSTRIVHIPPRPDTFVQVSSHNFCPASFPSLNELFFNSTSFFHLQHLIPHPSPELNFNETKNSFIMSSDMSGNVVKTPTGLKVNGSEKLDYNFHYVSPVFDISHAKLAETYKPWGRVLIVLDKSEFSVRFGRSPTCRARMFS